MSNLVMDFPRHPIRRRRSDLSIRSDDRTPRTRPPSVRFSATSTVHVYQESPRDPASWYSEEEEEAFKVQTEEEIAALRLIKENGLDCNQYGEEFSPVGLEQHLVSRGFTQKRLVARRMVKMAVLTEQDHCSATEVTEKQDRIARASRKHSRWSAVQAKTIGYFQSTNRID